MEGIETYSQYEYMSYLAQHLENIGEIQNAKSVYYTMGELSKLYSFLEFPPQLDLNDKKKLEFGIEIVAAMQASTSNWDIEYGRIETLADTEIDRLEEIELEEFNSFTPEVQERITKFCQREKERLHKQALFAADIALKFLKNA